MGQTQKNVIDSYNGVDDDLWEDLDDSNTMEQLEQDMEFLAQKEENGKSGWATPFYDIEHKERSWY